MPYTLRWTEIAIRLMLAVLSGALLGLNRGTHGRPAGMRTTILVSVAAALSMLQANLLIGTTGKQPGSFVVMDTMRLPLGILSGMGFIGAGAIIRHDDRVLGLTTAATLWLVTGIGLCFGGGQIGLGLGGTTIGGVTLWALGFLERRLRRSKRVFLMVFATPDGPNEQALRSALKEAGLMIRSLGVTFDAKEGLSQFRCEIEWNTLDDDTRIPAPIERIRRSPGVLRLEWRP